LNQLPTPVSQINALTGTYNYSLVSASVPTYTIASPGTISSGSLAADFTSNSASFNLPLSGGTFGATSVTGSGPISGSGISGTSQISWSGGASNASGTFTGIFTGSNAAQANIAYQIPYSAGQPPFGPVTGTASFSR
jgi:hypothetical protein